MILIKQIKLSPAQVQDPIRRDNVLRQRAAKRLRVEEASIETCQIRRQSIDARKKPDIFFVYEVLVKPKKMSASQQQILTAKLRDGDVTYLEETADNTEWIPTEKSFPKRILVIGMGPAGLFAAYTLAKAGFRPVVLERGQAMEQRTADVTGFWNGDALKHNSNVQFGEGGAGTFSDGKLNTMIKGEKNAQRYVLETFVAHGADPDILYTAKPHIGTDVLQHVVVSMREEILARGGEIHFNTQVTSFAVEQKRVVGVTCSDGTQFPCDACILAIGHSARDTFFTLEKQGFLMEPKPFAVGIRVQHPQELIDRAQYGAAVERYRLPVADYKLTAQTKGGRGVYSFCMCPGGYVVNASSEEGHLAINGMSYRKRDSGVANSAIVVTVRPEDYPKVADIPKTLSGVAFQRDLEASAFALAKGRVPVMRLGDFAESVTASPAFSSFTPMIKGAYQEADLHKCLPAFLCEAIAEGFSSFERKIHGFASPETLLCAVESRTSSPLRIVRDAQLESSYAGLYPCGEGAGYAGGITSAAVDGLRCAQKIIEKYY